MKRIKAINVITYGKKLGEEEKNNYWLKGNLKGPYGLSLHVFC